MIVVMTSCAPVRALRNPTIPPQIAPPSIPAAKATRRCSPGGRSQVKPTYPQKTAPMISWPWAPMLNSPARKANVTPRPAQISGAERWSVEEMALREPTEPLSSAQYDELTASHDRVKKSHG